MENNTGVNEFTAAELDQLFSSEFEQISPAANNETDGQKIDGETSNKDTTFEDVEDKSNKDVDTTKAFAKRLKESTDKARQEERETIAKSLGYESYEDMQKKRESQLLEDKGLDPEQVKPIVDELVKQKLEQDPRLKELDELRKQQVQEFAKNELAEITKLTNGEITELKQLPKEVIDLWKTKGSLKSAYLELEGEKLITKIRSEQSKGSTSHLVNPNGPGVTPTGKRNLTDHEKKVWLLFNSSTTQEELDKILVDK